MLVNTIVQGGFCHSGVATTNYSKLCKVTNVFAPVLSIMTNLSVMILTIIKAWYVHSFTLRFTVLIASLSRMLRIVLLESFRRKQHDKILSLFVLLIESGTLYVAALVRSFGSVTSFSF